MLIGFLKQFVGNQLLLIDIVAERISNYYLAR